MFFFRSNFKRTSQENFHFAEMAEVVEVSLYIQSKESKTKFHSRFETDIPVSELKVMELNNYIMHHIAVKKITGAVERERLFVKLPKELGDIYLKDGETVQGSSHVEAIYKTYGNVEMWKAEHEKIKNNHPMDDAQDDFVLLLVRNPYSRSGGADRPMQVSPTTSIGVLLETMKQDMYQECPNQPEIVHCMMLWGAPTGYNENSVVSMEKTSLESMLNSAHDTAFEEGFHRGMLQARANDTVAMSEENTQATETAETPFSAQSGYKPFAGQPMKLDDTVQNEVVKSTAETKDEEGKWENESVLIGLNEKSAKHAHPVNIQIEGKLAYVFYSAHDTDFKELFDVLNLSGVSVGAPDDITKKNILKYGTSSAYRHEKLYNWNCLQNPTYMVIPKVLGGGVIKKFSKAKSSATASASSPRDEKIEKSKRVLNDINAQLSQITFIQDRVSDISSVASEKMKTVFELVESNKANNALCLMLRGMSEEDLGNITSFNCSRAEDKMKQVSEYLFENYLPKLAEAHDSLSTAKASCEAVIEMAVVSGLSRESGEISWKTLAEMATREMEVRRLFAERTKQ